MNEYFKLFSNCIPVKGYNRAIICDLQRNSYEFIPNELYDFFDGQYSFKINNISERLSIDDQDTLKEYISFLIEKEYGFYCSKEELNLFPLMSLKWDYPSQITNAIIDVNIDSNHNYRNILSQLESLGCKYLQIRVYCEKPLDYFIDICNIINPSSFRGVDIIMRYTSRLNIEEVCNWVDTNIKIRALFIHNAENDKVIQYDNHGFGLIVLLKEEIKNSSHCGVVNPSYFSINIDTFTESQLYNSCLNRKIGIDIYGNIKNCPSLEKEFGNVNTHSLYDVLKNGEFSAPWTIKKDDILICNDCEFRYICTDCRAYIQDKNNPNSKPLKCNYDPYTSSWNETLNH